MRSQHWMILCCVVALMGPAAAQAATPAEKQKAQHVAQQIRESGQLTNYRVGVKFENGTASLFGNVTDKAQAQAAMRIAKQVDGVASVVNKLKITGSETTAASSLQQVASERPATSQMKEQADALLLSLQEEAAVATPQPVAQAPQLERPVAPRQMQRPMQRRPRNSMPRPMVRTAARAPRGIMQGRGQGYASKPPVSQSRQAGVQPAGYGAGMAPAQAGYAPAGGAGAVSGVSHDTPNMPGYAWPSYASQNNYSAVSYPKQYSPTAWPYIGPFYPYPQVPLGWRKVALEWDDGWWFLDFSHHQHH